MKVIAEVKIKNRMGLHTRPAATIVKILQNSNCDVTFTYAKETVNAKSILSLLMLAAPENALIAIEAVGEDAGSTIKELIDAFSHKFGESV